MYQGREWTKCLPRRSGGPLVIKDDNGGSDLQVGVVSWGIICAADQFPNVHARVSQAYDWIQSEVCKGDEYASEAGFDCSSISTTPPILSPTNPPIFLPTNSPIFSPTTDGDLLDDLLDVILVRLTALGLKVYTRMWCLIQQKIIRKRLIGCCQITWRMNESAQRWETIELCSDLE